ncbi:MAG TPA: ABC transporter ATP-binding protein [Gemmatimonadales bacterium]|nr:ABC transporter ATP-binding protein [Gemmatimonadales bacterium]
MIEVEGLTKLYGDRLAVRELSFTVQPGEVLGLVGPNGAGKTTTLRSVAGIIRPSAGQIRIAGHDLRAEPIAAKSRLAFIPDEPHLFDYLTVGEHLDFVARLYNVTEAGERRHALLSELELLDRVDSFPPELSRGMKQKLASACGLFHSPSALMFDEPLTGLDPIGIRRMKATILRRAQEGAAVILSSHLLHLVEELCTRVLVLRQGVRVATGALGDIIAERPELAGRSLEDVFIALVGDTGSP